ncbi:MAG: luciferase family protein, partial [Rubrobacteraceae bacterium]
GQTLNERSKMTDTGTPPEGTNAASRGFPDGLPERSGERPRTSDRMPHEQLSLNAPPELQERLRERVLAMPEVVSGASGVSVPGARAFFLDHQNSDAPKMMSGEFAHIHPPYDGSLHAMLPRDVAEKVVEKGWGELHPYSRGGRDSWANVLIFGPRDEAELETVYRIVRASHDYVQGNAQDVEPGNDKETTE